MFNKKQLIYAIIPHILKAVIAIGIALVIVSFFGARITTIEVTLKERKAMTFALRQRSETTATLRNMFGIIGESDGKIRDAFPITDNVLEFVTAVETLAGQNTMQQSLKFAAPDLPISETASLTVIPVGYTMTTNGTVATLANYLRQFEALPYFAGVHAMTLSTASPKGWDDNSSITIQGTLYTQKSL